MELQWQWPPAQTDALTITTLDVHAAGEPLRIVTGGLPELPGATILERRRYIREHLDHAGPGEGTAEDRRGEHHRFHHYQCEGA